MGSSPQIQRCKVLMGTSVLSLTSLSVNPFLLISFSSSFANFSLSFIFPPKEANRGVNAVERK